MGSSNENRGLIPTSNNEITVEESNSRLVKRGLTDLERDSLSPEEIVSLRRDHTYLKGLSDESITLAVKKPPAWEYRLYPQVLSDEVDGYESLRQARLIGFSSTPPVEIQFEELFSWSNAIFDELNALGHESSRLTNEDLQVAFGAPGQPGDVEAIILIARKQGLIYKHFLEISIRCNNVKGPPILKNVFQEMSKLGDEAINEFEDYPKRTLKTIMQMLSGHSDDKQKEVKLEMSFSVIFDNLNAEMEKAIEKHKKKMM